MVKYVDFKFQPEENIIAVRKCFKGKFNSVVIYFLLRKQF